MPRSIFALFLLPALAATAWCQQPVSLIDAKKPVADRSAYTVIVARRVELYDGPNLYLNTDYGSVDIPVPKGVGPNGSQVWLSR